MESMGILGFIFGMSALSIAVIARQHITDLQLELDELKQKFENSGMIK